MSKAYQCDICKRYKNLNGKGEGGNFIGLSEGKAKNGDICWSKRIETCDECQAKIEKLISSLSEQT